MKKLMIQYDVIHRQAPGFDELSTKVEILETGIKVVDLLAPYIKVVVPV